jgi:amino acid transporter
LVIALTEELKIEPFLRKSTGLVKEVGPIGSMMLPWASMAGSGISLYAIQVIYSYPEGNVPAAFLMVGIPVIFSIVTFALLGITTPRSGGPYIWTSRYIDPFLGWLGCGYIYWISTILSIGLVGYTVGVLMPVMFVLIGNAAGLPALTALGTLISTSTTFTDGVIIFMIVATGLLCLLEIKHFMKIAVFVWALNTLGLIVSMGLFAMNNPSTVPAAWNNVWGMGSYQMIVNLSTKYNLAGYISSTTGGSWNDTISIVAYIFWALMGYELNTYMAGEVRNPRSSFLYWYIFGSIGTVLWYVLVTWLAYNAYGPFILQYNYVYNLFTAGKLTANETSIVTPYMLAPTMPLFASSLGTNAVTRILGAWWFYPVTALLVMYLPGTRTMFGLSFDRMFPSVFGKVNDRTHTPIEATLACIVGAVLIALLDFTSFGFLVSAANTSFWVSLVYLLVAIVAVTLPYKRPDIWEKGVHRKILGIPDMTFFGAFAVIGMFWILELSAVGVSVLAWNVSVLWLAFGVFIYLFFVHHNMKRGIKVNDIFGEIPPP